MPVDDLAQLKAERDWLRRRARIAGTSHAGPRDYGISSNAMIEYALGGPYPDASEFPLDPSDLAACERAYRSAPEHLKPRMRPVLVCFRMSVEKEYPDATARVLKCVDSEEARDA